MSSVAERQKVDDFRLDRDQIITIKVLGSGNFGQVSKAVYKPLNFEVAVKSLKVPLIFLTHCYIATWKATKSLEFKSDSLLSYLSILSQNRGKRLL